MYYRCDFISSCNLHGLIPDSNTLICHGHLHPYCFIGKLRHIIFLAQMSKKYRLQIIMDQSCQKLSCPLIGKVPFISQYPLFQIIRIRSDLKHIDIMVCLQQKSIHPLQGFYCIIIVIAKVCYDRSLFPSMSKPVSHRICSIMGNPHGIAAYILDHQFFIRENCMKQIFRDLSISLAGAKRGGPAKIAVISSAIMGTISGSAIANVVTTGAFTIPLMKKQKYRDEFAGAVEAVSSTGGQLMPPVMGAAAFLMAEATAIPYGTICLAALVPALMYYICIFCTVDVESLKANLTGMDLKDIPKLLPVLKKSAKLLLPIAVLILSLCVFGFSTSRSALYSMAVLIICCCFDKDDRFSLKKLVNALRSGAIGSTTVITATAICGIIISMLTMTGLGVKFSSLLISLGSSSLLISLLLAMLVCIVLGMGLPTAAAYIIASSTIATALIKLGVPVLGAHMFLFYFSSIACITPPVALASYAAAGICKAPPMKVSMEAVKIGIVAFLVPYAFIYNPSILTYDFSSPYMILDTIVTFVCCVVDALPISYVVQGYHYRPIRLYERALFLVIAIGLIWPGVVVPLVSLAVFLLFWLPARAKYYKENPKLPTPAAN